MGGILGGKPKQDPQIAKDIAAREKAAEEREKRLKLEADSKRKARRGQSGARGLLSGLETGVVGGDSNKLGGGS